MVKKTAGIWKMPAAGYGVPTRFRVWVGRNMRAM